MCRKRVGGGGGRERGGGGGGGGKVCGRQGENGHAETEMVYRFTGTRLERNKGEETKVVC